MITESNDAIGTPGRKGVDASRKPSTPYVQVSARDCLYSRCKRPFTPKSAAGADAKFCCAEHKSLHWKEAAEIGNRILSGNGGELLSLVPVKGRTHNEQVLNVLRSANGEWVDSPQRRLPFVVWHSRVADLRRKNYVIECRRLGGFRDKRYQYRIIEGEK